MIQVLFGGVMLVSIAIALAIWYYKYKPLYYDALALLREIQGE